MKEVLRALGLEGGSPASAQGIATKGEIKVEDAKRQRRFRAGTRGDHHAPRSGGKAEQLVAGLARHHGRYSETMLEDGFVLDALGWSHKT